MSHNSQQTEAVPPFAPPSGYATATNPRAYEVVPMPGDARYWWIVRREDNLALSTTGLFSRSLAVTFAKELNKLHDAKSHSEKLSDVSAYRSCYAPTSYGINVSGVASRLTVGKEAFFNENEAKTLAHADLTKRIAELQKLADACKPTT